MSGVDWKLAAAAFAPDIPEEQVERIKPLLEKLEEALRPVLDGVPVDFGEAGP